MANRAAKGVEALSEKRLILTNDDGIEAPGLEALTRMAEGLGPAITVAPAGPQSGCGHTLTTHSPFRIDARGPRAFAVEGTPADCVRMALHHLNPEFNWVLSGINAGGNLGADVFHSGTVAAAREAVLHGKPAVAFSQYIIKGHPLDWDLASRWARQTLMVLWERPWEPGTFWNVNLPHLPTGSPDPELVFCPLDPSPLPVAYRLDGEFANYEGVYANRQRQKGADVDVCFSGQIAVTRVRIFSPPENLEP